MHAESIWPCPAKSAALALLEAAGLPVADLTDGHLEHFYFCGPSAAPTGMVGLEPCGRDAFLQAPGL
jgi:hypothetical protein